MMVLAPAAISRPALFLQCAPEGWGVASRITFAIRPDPA
jgi:hypothetical protein